MVQGGTLRDYGFDHNFVHKFKEFERRNFYCNFQMNSICEEYNFLIEKSLLDL